MKYCIKLNGMGCAHCISRITLALNSIGADIISVELNKAVIDYGNDTSPIKEAVEDLGFELVSIEAMD